MSSLSDHEFAHGLLQTRQQSLNKAVEVFKEGLLELKNAAQAEFRSLEHSGSVALFEAVRGQIRGH
jgi:hypothetical protein